MTLATLIKELIGSRVVRVDGRDDACYPSVSAIAFDNGIVLRFTWSAGIDDGVGVRVGRADPVMAAEPEIITHPLIRSEAPDRTLSNPIGGSRVVHFGVVIGPS